MFVLGRIDVKIQEKLAIFVFVGFLGGELFGLLQRHQGPRIL
jgi:hypothetical protein